MLELIELTNGDHDAAMFLLIVVLLLPTGWIVAKVFD
jgi:hypothetical protein